MRLNKKQINLPSSAGTQGSKSASTANSGGQNPSDSTFSVFSLRFSLGK